MFHIYCTNRPGDVKPGSLGRVVEGYELRDPARGRRRPRRRPSCRPARSACCGSRATASRTATSSDRDKSWKTFHGHWCRTGDLFSIDEQGYLWFQGRADDLFKVGGVFVAPREVEDCLLAHPAVSVVRGDPRRGRGPDQAQGDRRAAARRARARPTAALADELQGARRRRGCRSTSIRAGSMFVDDLPKNDRGKVDKKTLIEREKRGELSAET